ncbi:MAG: hypothetical protein Tsb0014_03790 [Pleurocapsa sp.]
MSVNIDREIILVDKLLNRLDDNSGLSDVQELVFRESFLGSSYKEIADNSGYEYEYLKKVGSQLWRLLSQVLGEKISKSNVRSRLNQYKLQNSFNSMVWNDDSEKNFLIVDV